MFWPLLTLLAAAVAVGAHLWWRSRFHEAQAAADLALHELAQEHAQATRQLENQQTAVFDSMAEGLLLLDHQGRVRLANRAFLRLFNVTADIRSRTILEALRSHELAELIDALGRQNQILGRELKLAHPSELWLQVNGSSISDGSGGRQGTILVFHDLTRVKHLERTRQEFVANVSHELRTPLSLIKGYIETLLDGAKDNPEIATRFLQTIERNADRLNLLIEDLLSISELESGRVKPNLQVVPLRSVTDKVLADFRTRAEAKQMELVDRVPDLLVRSDPARLEQVVCNLIDNAIKYGRGEGHIVITASPAPASQVEVSVQDDGPGIPPESLERIFERFYRVDKARSREQGGTGLGLSIVKHIVQSHGGRVWATSEAGRGATFHFTLPQELPATG
jgi:two-component system, OmpR family, phosphate regulon sensor histidine kinase PhoR